MPNRTWQSVAIREICAAGDRYSFSWPSPEALEETRRSVERYGLLRPLRALRSRGRFELVAGRRRMEILAALGVEEAPVGLVEAEGRALWDLLLEDQLTAGPLNPVEVGLYLARRRRDTGEDAGEVAAAVHPRLGLAPRATAAEDPLWIAGLPDRYRDAFARGSVPQQGVRVLRRAPREDALAVLDLVSGHPMGVNKFTEFARWCLEAAWGEGQEVRAWANRREILEAPDATGLREVVRRLRFPAVTRWEGEFDRDLRSVGLPPGARVGHARGFEGGRLTCTVAFGTLAEFEDALRELLGALEDGRFACLERYLG